MRKFLMFSLLLSSCDISEEVQNNVDVCKVINPDWRENEEPVSPNGFYDVHTHEEGDSCRLNSECLEGMMCLCWTCVSLPPIDIVVIIPPSK